MRLAAQRFLWISGRRENGFARKGFCFVRNRFRAGRILVGERAGPKMRRFRAIWPCDGLAYCRRGREAGTKKGLMMHIAGRPEAAAWHWGIEVKMQSIRSPSNSPKTWMQIG